MRFLLVFFLIVLSPFAIADSVISTQIYDIDMGQGNDEPLIFLTTGQVVSYPSADKSMMTSLRSAITQKRWLEVTINEDREIVSLKELPSPPSISSSYKKMITEEVTEPFTPSILKDMDHARSFFYEANTKHRPESQCFNRAHVWSYEWRTKKNLYSSKAWVFFTRKFIRKYKFEWWFHVAPMVHVVSDGKVRERVMDIKYAKGPLKIKQWTDIFMRDNANCPVVEKYSDQANYPESGSCFVMKSSMYYYQPVDLELKELTGAEKTKWLEPEVRHAYIDGFGIRLGEANE